jgi:RNA-directed DNA polymerase
MADSLVARQTTQSPMFGHQLMEEVCERSNLQLALKRVRQNGGAPGVDGMSVDDLRQHLKENWPAIKQQLLEGSYPPTAVRRVRIPKPTGKDKRELGIPCVVDRFIQQAMLQVLQRKWDKRFSDYSYGFRPARRAHHAVAQAQSYLKQGYECGHRLGKVL